MSSLTSSQAQDAKAESSLDIAAHATPAAPGRAAYYVVVSRNVKQWRVSIDYADADEETPSDVTLTPKSAQSEFACLRETGYRSLLVQQKVWKRKWGK